VKSLEQGGHTAHAFSIEVRHGLGLEFLDRRRVPAERESVADEQNRIRARRDQQHSKAQQDGGHSMAIGHWPRRLVP
jgi:hypothetical protein